VNRSKAFAKINLALVAGPRRADGKHEVVTVLQRISLHDVVELERVRGPGISVEGYTDDTLVRAALEELARAEGASSGWQVRIEKRIPVAAGLGGGSSDAASALVLANAFLPESLPHSRLHAVGARIGADVPFFLTNAPQLARGDGSELSSIELPADFVVLIALANGQRKESTAAVYRQFDGRLGPRGFEVRRAALLDELSRVGRAHDLARLPRNDLVSSPLAGELERLGAFRADVTGAGPAVYGLFDEEDAALRVAESLEGRGHVWLARPLA
jgi:4-diphosphocytidyl-2-C-methyl-D-erythritol kinase